MEWLPNHSGLSHGNVGDCGAVPRNSPGVKCAAFGQDHALLLREIGTDGDGGGEPQTEVLGWGSGGQGQVIDAAKPCLPCTFKKNCCVDLGRVGT